MQHPAHYLLYFLTACVTTGCGEHPIPARPFATDIPTPSDTAAMRRLVEARNAAFTQAHITGDTAVLNSYFTSDARVLAPGATAVIGRQAIAQLNAQYVAFGIQEFTETTTHFQVDRDHLIDEGTYFMRLGEGVTEHGKYLNIWKREHGEWRVCTNIWNTDH